MDVILGALADQLDELAQLLAGLDPDEWDRPSRCEGWTVGDVVLHLAQTNEMAVGSATGRFDEVLADLLRGAPPAADVEDGAGLMVSLERGASSAEVHDRWVRSAEALNDVLAAIDLGERVTWVAGRLSARTLATTRLAETWIHTGDVADAIGVDVAPTDRLWQIARLAWRTLPYAFTTAGRELGGPVSFVLRGPGGDTWEFVPEEPALTKITGDAEELCLVAARRAQPGDTSLVGVGPDAAAVLELVRTFA